LWRSQTGKRLREYIPPGADYKVINANPTSANDGNQIHPPNETYVLGHIADYQPDVVVLLGKVAGQLRGRINRPTLSFPHPTYRLLSKRATADYRDAIQYALGQLQQKDAP